MPAPTGNKSAEKWTLERTLEALKTIDSYSCSSDCMYLGHALQVAGYYNDVWAYWKRKWRTRFEVMNMMKKIMQRFEVRLFDKMCNGKIPSQAAMFALKHHYGWGRDPYKEYEPDLQYIENEPAPEEKPEASAAVEVKTPEAVKFEANMLKDITSIQEYNHAKIQEYNRANPHDPIITSAVYFDGVPPRGLKAIVFGDGYFMKH